MDGLLIQHKIAVGTMAKIAKILDRIRKCHLKCYFSDLPSNGSQCVDDDEFVRISFFRLLNPHSELRENCDRTWTSTASSSSTFVYVWIEMNEDEVCIVLRQEGDFSFISWLHTYVYLRTTIKKILLCKKEIRKVKLLSSYPTPAHGLMSDTFLVKLIPPPQPSIAHFFSLM